MRNLSLFTDGSLDPKTNTGWGAYLILSGITPTFQLQTENIKVKQFDNTSSTKLELQTLLWALAEVVLLNPNDITRIIVYTDSQNIVGLPKRRAKLEGQNYFSRNGKLLNHSELYQEFFRFMDRLNCRFIKVKGHKAKDKKDEIDWIFALVDRASRAALRT